MRTLERDFLYGLYRTGDFPAKLKRRTVLHHLVGHRPDGTGHRTDHRQHGGFVAAAYHQGVRRCLD